MLQDVSGDYLVNGDNGTTPGSPIVQVGSILLSGYRLSNVNNDNGTTSIGNATYSQLSGLVAIQVTGETGSPARTRGRLGQRPRSRYRRY